jgi:hypothetical protein
MSTNTIPNIIKSVGNLNPIAHEVWKGRDAKVEYIVRGITGIDPKVEFIATDHVGCRQYCDTLTEALAWLDLPKY